MVLIQGTYLVIHPIDCSLKNKVTEEETYDGTIFVYA